jgi:cobyrinic acid a,c-diamide synthase
MVTLPRIVIAAAASSAGKTTIATGLMAALRAAGHDVAGFKVGPDFIDPGYHALATGRPGRNLDAVLCGEDLIAPLLLHGSGASSAEIAEIAIIEGAMGLFDGQLGRNGFGSTAHIAALIQAPVVLVVDAARSSRTAAAVAAGLRTFDARIQIASVVVNRVASPRHAAELRAVFNAVGLPVLGTVPRNSQISAPSRHLGLVPAAERGESIATIAALAEHIAQHLDLDEVVKLAQTAPELAARPWQPAEVMRPIQPRASARPRVGVFGGRAFTFRYAETTELLSAAGCDIVEIDPLTDSALPPELSGLYLGGGFPEVHAAQLSANTSLRQQLAAAVRAGLPTIAECAGQLYLSQDLDGHPMAGVLPATARMTPRLTLGYRTATATTDSVLASAGYQATGHEFHRTQTSPPAGTASAWSWSETSEGFSLDFGAGPSLHASYLHLHWAGHPHLAQRFAQACADYLPSDHRMAPPALGIADGIDLHHHGDHDVAPDLIDLAVNVSGPPPQWLAAAINEANRELASYPDPSPARKAIADAHGLDPAMVLPTAGAAEAFTLIARAVSVTHPLVVHPQFTEPEAALRAAGHAVQRWLLPVTSTHTVPTLTDLPAWADAVFVGNPTNPTGWLHHRDDLRVLADERLLVVDEAFMDATDEHQSLIAPVMTNRLVVRSLSKTWGLAGLRVGYVVGDPALIATLENAQPAWPLSAPAIAAMIATSSATALAEAELHYAKLASWRQHLVAALAEAGFPTLPSSAPFVLIDTTSCGTESVRPALAKAGFAVRRGESFPGLGPAWIRVKVTAPAISHRLVKALAALRR